MLAGGLGPENVARGDRRTSARGRSTRARASRPSRASRTTSACALGEPRRDDRRAVRRRTAAATSPRRWSRRSTSSRPAGARRARTTRSAASCTSSAATYAGRPTPLTLAERFAPGKRLYLKREDLLHTGAHKLNNALGQAVLARRLGKQRIVAETGAGQHGVATATVCARFGLDCVVYMGSEDMRRQRPNVERMELLGAEVRPVEFGTRTLKEATSEAIRDWITNVETTHYLIGSCVGPHPYPEIVRELQSVIGARRASSSSPPRAGCPRSSSPASAAARTRSGSSPASSTTRTCGSSASRPRGAASLGTGRTGVLHGARSSILADEDGQIADAHSISAGLDYPGVGPEHAALRDSGRAELRDAHRRGGARRVPAARARRRASSPRSSPRTRSRARADLDAELVLVCLSGRGDKDLDEVLAR